MLSDTTSSCGGEFGCAVLRDDKTGSVLLELVGELDLASAPDVDRVLSEIAATRPPLVVVDLRRLAFMDSSGLHVLLDAAARRRESGVRLSVVRGGAQISRLLALTGAERHLTLVDRVPDGSWALPVTAAARVARRVVRPADAHAQARSGTR